MMDSCILEFKKGVKRERLILLNFIYLIIFHIFVWICLFTPVISGWGGKIRPKKSLLPQAKKQFLEI
jgi:hypothetical protein